MRKLFSAHPALSFIVRTVCYAAIILFLIYLYSYRGVAGAHFIYNEF